jgi:hypothetical protein
MRKRQIRLRSQFDVGPAESPYSDKDVIAHPVDLVW